MKILHEKWKKIIAFNVSPNALLLTFDHQGIWFSPNRCLFPCSSSYIFCIACSFSSYSARTFSASPSLVLGDAIAGSWPEIAGWEVGGVEAEFGAAIVSPVMPSLAESKWRK